MLALHYHTQTLSERRSRIDRNPLVQVILMLKHDSFQDRSASNTSSHDGSASGRDDRTNGWPLIFEKEGGKIGHAGDGVQAIRCHGGVAAFFVVVFPTVRAFLFGDEDSDVETEVRKYGEQI